MSEKTDNIVKDVQELVNRLFKEKNRPRLAENPDAIQKEIAEIALGVIGMAPVNVQISIGKDENHIIINGLWLNRPQGQDEQEFEINVEDWRKALSAAFLMLM
jgi:hypothetical protein